MTSRYRVEYQLKSHRRDELIEWIKGLLAVPFVLHADAENHLRTTNEANFQSTDSLSSLPQRSFDKLEDQVAMECQKRYAEVFRDVEKLIDRTIYIDKLNEGLIVQHPESRLRKLVPSVGKFFTSLPLVEAFLIEDERRFISRRRLVSPSFNDVRIILNTAQVLALTKIYDLDNHKADRLKLITFDGDVTLYEDGQNLTPDAPVVERLMKLLKLNMFIAVVTAAGYPGKSGAENYYYRLKGLLDRIKESDELTDVQKENFFVMGGESNYLFRYNVRAGQLVFIEADEWYPPLMALWSKFKINYIMDSTYEHLLLLQKRFDLVDNTTIIKKERSVGIIPNKGYKILREELEEMVLSCSNKLNDILTKLSSDLFSIDTVSDHQERFTRRNSLVELTQDENIRVCAFNGGQDVWVDIGDKALGVELLQKFLCREELLQSCPILKSESLHVGDQFASVGANDYKARLSACTAWIASPRETVAILDDLIARMEDIVN